jgi:FAD/FMN-containing dehydrogenase
MFQWSYGTLGFIVCAELKIVPAKKFVRMEYTPHFTQEDYCKYVLLDTYVVACPLDCT